MCSVSLVFISVPEEKVGDEAIPAGFPTLFRSRSPRPFLLPAPFNSAFPSPPTWPIFTSLILHQSLALREEEYANFPAATGISFGAFGSHGLRSRFPTLPERSLNSWSTASNYLIYNGLALLAVSLHPGVVSGIKKNFRFAAGMILGGSLTFSGTIFALVLYREKVGKVLGPITPLGGMVMIGG